MQFLSHQARRLLRSIKNISSHRILPLQDFSAALDIGIWSEWYSHSVEDYIESNKDIVSKPFERFEVTEGNFYSFLGQDSLCKLITAQGVEEETLESLEDLAITVVKILDICGRGKEAIFLAENC